MIIKASQRGGAGKLSAHLLNANDNEHIKVHEVRGFMSDTLHEALQEAHAISQGTKCKQFLFSVSLNPPKNKNVPIVDFENAVDRIEKKMGLDNHPRAIVFHEKHGRRHAHAVWSRIDTQDMKAINLPFYKNKLMEISKELHLENDWKLPKGFINREQRNPLNFTLAQWKQAQRRQERPETIKQALKECWSISKTKAAFENNFDLNGYYLAKGDRRGYVAVDWRGEVYSLSRWLNTKNKTLEERLGTAKLLASVDETKAQIDQKLVDRMQKFADELKTKHEHDLAPLLAHRHRMKMHHQHERTTLLQEQEKRYQQETSERQARFHSGLRGLWERLNGNHSRIKEQNERETYQSLIQNREENDRLIQSQLEKRGRLQTKLQNLTSRHEKENQQLKAEVFSKVPDDKMTGFQQGFHQAPHNQNQTDSPQM